MCTKETETNSISECGEEKVDEVKAQVLSNISHEMRTRINGIMGMVHIAKTHRWDDFIIDDCLKKIEISANDLLMLLNDVSHTKEQIKPEILDGVIGDDVADSLNGVRILIVEDNELNMEIAQVILEEAGAMTTPAENGKIAVEIFDQSLLNSYDIILMDITMPEMDGLEATRVIRAMERPDAVTIPIIAMTANAFAEDIKKSREAGMNAHIAKPLDMASLAVVVADLIK